MKKNDRSKWLPGTVTAFTVVGSLAGTLALFAGCDKADEPPKPQPLFGSPEENGGGLPPPTPPSEPVIVITAAGPQLNGEALPLEAIVARVREYIRTTDEPGTTKALTVTIQPDVRIKAENEARATLGQLEQGPDRCTVLFETPPAPGGRFPSRGD